MPLETPMLHADTWLGSLLGRTAYTVKLDYGRATDLLGAELDVAVAQAEAEGASCFAKAPVDRVDLCRLLTARGFFIADTNVQFRKAAEAVAPARIARCRLAVAADAAAVERVARESFVYTRFHLDPAIPRQVADAIKAGWAANYFTGKRGDAMVVAEVDGRIAGFNQLLTGGHGDRIIDLIGVHPDYHRRGLGRELCLFAETLTAVGGPMLVGTQVANTPSINLYETLGYRLAGASYVFHRHPSSLETP